MSGTPGPQQMPAPTKTPVDARQGVISGRVVTVLIMSVLLVIIALAFAYFFAR